MIRRSDQFDAIVVGGGHAGAEAAWAAANLGARVALVTMNADKIGQMSCNPAIGGLAKGQMVREIDALGGLMGLAADATGIQFRVLNSSKGPAVRGPRCQSDKYAYAAEVTRLLRTRSNITIIEATVERLLTENNRCVGALIQPRIALPESRPHGMGDGCGVGASLPDFNGFDPRELRAPAVVLTTGTFMRGLMHRGEDQTPGGRIGEAPALTISDELKRLGLELGRLKTGTPPRLAKESIDLNQLEEQWGDPTPLPFSELSALGTPISPPFPPTQQACCWITETNTSIHELIRENLHRAPMYNGQIDTAGPRYCPSIEDKVVRFADKHEHHVFLEPESHTTNEVYCNGISTSLPADVQERIVHGMRGCENARILKHGYAVEYDMVWPHQIDATTMTKQLPGLFLAGQINGTTGYEEAAAQGLIAGLNAARFANDQPLIRLQRDQAYIGVLLDDLVTKVPREPYRMFTSRSEHRLILRSDNAPDRLTPLGRELGLVDDARWSAFEQRNHSINQLRTAAANTPAPGAVSAKQMSVLDWMKRPDINEAAAEQLLNSAFNESTHNGASHRLRLITSLLSEIKYAGFIDRHLREHDRVKKLEHRDLPTNADYLAIKGLRNEARHTLDQFRPATLGQAGRLAGITPADVTVLAFALNLR